MISPVAFWSPDSRNIAFFAGGQPRRIFASGGPSQAICAASNGRGGTWSRDDVILFSPSFGDRVIRRVPAAGGVPADVVKTNGPAIFPMFLPDGRHFLYTVSSGTDSGIFLGSLDGKERRRVLADASRTVFARYTGSRAGHLLFLRENNLMAEPFDGYGAQPTGEVFPVAEGVGLAQANFVPVSVSDNGMLLYWTGGTGGGVFEMVWYDRSGKVLEPVGVRANVLMPAISPDEKTIAFSKLVGGGGDIWLHDLVRGSDQRLTTNADQNISPFWSPKTGAHIVFRSIRNGHEGDLYLRATSGAGQDEPLISTPNPKWVDQWSPGFIIYSEADPKTKADLWYLPVAEDGKPSGKATTYLHSEFNEIMGQLSPDSRWMAYASDRTGQREVYVQPFPTADNEMRVSLAGGEQPRWRADGKELFYLAADGRINAVAVTLTAEPKPSIKFGPPMPLFDAHSAIGNNQQAFFNYDISRDGKRFLVSTDGGITSSSSATTPPLTVHVNWNAAAKK